jgi:hypothetical protein
LAQKSLANTKGFLCAHQPRMMTPSASQACNPAAETSENRYPSPSEWFGLWAGPLFFCAPALSAARNLPHSRCLMSKRTRHV